MKFFRYFLFILALLISCQATDSVLAASQTFPSGISCDDMEETIDHYVEEHKETTTGMEIAIFNSDSILFQKEYGYINKEENIKLNADSVLDWGSISKTLIWVSAMQLWESGQLDLTSDIRQYLPDGFLTNLRYDTPVTMIDLMNHKGGFQESYTDMYLRDSDKILPLGEQLQKHEPLQIFEPGTVTSYSNWGAALAAYTIECISGQSFADYVHEYIFKPLHMEHTAILPDLSDQNGILKKRLETICYTDKGTPLPVSFYHIPLYPCGMCAGTLDDLILYTQALIPNENKSCPLFQNEDTLQQLFSPTSYIGSSKNARICHGFLVNYYAVPVLGHGGNSYGCSSQLHIDPESGIGTVVMVNQYLETVYTKEMMPLIYGSYDLTSNLEMPKPSQKQYVRLSQTFWKGPFKILNLIYTFHGTPDGTIPYTLSENGKYIELADICDLIMISPQEFIIGFTLILLLFIIAAYTIIAGGIGVFFVHCKKTSSPNPLLHWHNTSCGFMAIWILNVIFLIYQVGIANSPCEYYQWQIALNGILAILMIAALIWLLLHRKIFRQKESKKILPKVTGFCLVISVIIIFFWDMYQFWNI